MIKPITNRAFLLGLFLIAGICPNLRAQIDAEVTVDVTLENGVYTYDYTVANSILSSLSANAFLLTVGKGDSVVIPTTDEAVDPLAGHPVSAPENWVGVYQPYLLTPPCDPTELNSLAADFQVGWVAGDGEVTPVSAEFDILQGESLSFSVSSRWGPGIKEYLVGKLSPGPCAETDFVGLALGEVEVPTVPPPPTAGPSCDFDEDGDCDLIDIDLLAEEVTAGTNTDSFDLTEDAFVDIADINAFLADDSVNRLNGDADFNGEVDFADFLKVSDNFEQAASWSDGDFDGNGLVQFGDFLILANNFGKTPGAAAAVPEPASGLQLLAVFGGIVVAFRHSSRSRS